MFVDFHGLVDCDLIVITYSDVTGSFQNRYNRSGPFGERNGSNYSLFLRAIQFAFHLSSHS